MDPAPQLPERFGAYQIRGALGQGSSSVVYDAVAPDGRPVALKILSVGSSARADQATARFLREARILEQVAHPGVVRLCDSGEIDGTLYLALERIEGTSLLTLRRNQPFAFEPLRQLGIQLAEALAHLHERGIVHRDIKPANVLVTDQGRAVIADFGISGLAEATGITRQGELLGSPGFIAPEVVDGDTATPLSDQYALGRLLFELGAQGPAAKLSKSASIFVVLQEAQKIDWARFPQDPPWNHLRYLVERMLAPAPLLRFPDCNQVALALAALPSADALDGATLADAPPFTLEKEAPALPPFPPFTPLSAPPAPPPVVPRSASTARALSAWSSNDSPEHHEQTRVERQLQRLREELAEARAHRPRHGLWAVFALFLGVLGFFGGWSWPRPMPEPSVLLIPAPGPATAVPAGQNNLVEANQLLTAAEEQLAGRHYDTALTLLQLCVDRGDLPRCHLLMGTLLAVTRDPRARGHLQRYLDAQPNTPESTAIQKHLTGP